MATHSSVLAWRIPATGEPGGLPSVGSHRVGHPVISKARRVFSFAEKNLSSLGADPLSPPASPSLSSDGGGGCTHTKQADSSHCFPTWVKT